MRRQFVSVTLAVTSMIVVAFVLPLAFLVRTIAADRATSQANADAQYVGQIIAGNRASAPTLVAQADASAPGRISVYYPDGTVVGDRSRPPAADSLLLASRGRSFSRSTSAGVDVFLPVLGPPGQTAVVRVSVSRNELRRGVTTAWLSLGALAVVLLLIAGLVADRMARSVVQPISTVTRIARLLAAGDLDARSEVKGSPEVVEVSHALDTLAARIGELLQDEREHAAALSHGLRTPLTALRLDAERLHDPGEARRIMTAVDDLEEAVTRVITDTRRENRAHEPREVDLGEIVRERVAFWEVLARAQQRTIDERLHPGPLFVRARRRDVQQLVDVLVDNVLRHTSPGVRLRVSTDVAPDGGAVFSVDDAGRGLSTRFGRRTEGSGRGLEIARRIARDSGGTVSLGRSDLGGTHVDVVLGPPHS